MSILVGVLEIQEKKDKKSCNPAKLIKIRTARTQHNLAIVDVPKSSTRQMALMEIQV
jgi:hypothetical protein